MLANMHANAERPILLDEYDKNQIKQMLKNEPTLTLKKIKLDLEDELGTNFFQS